MPPKPRKYKTTIKVLDESLFQGVCSCTWEGSRMAAKTDLGKTLAAIQSEIQAHNHIPKPKKGKK